MRPVKLGVLLRLGRVSNLPTVWTNTLAGVALSGAAVSGLPLWALCLGASLFYVGGMYLNDAFDAAVDLQERPDRPIPSGQISRRATLLLGLAMLAAGAALCLWIAQQNSVDGWLGAAPAALGLPLCIVLYDLYHKQNPLSPVLMGVCRALLYLLAAQSLGGAVGKPLLFAMLGTLAYLIGLTYVAKQETLNKVHNLWPLLCLALPGIEVAMQGVEPSVLSLLLVWLLWTAHALSAVLVPHLRDIPAAVTRFIAGIALLDAVWAMQAGAALLALLCVVFFVSTRAAQRFIPGT